MGFIQVNRHNFINESYINSIVNISQSNSNVYITLDTGTIIRLNNCNIRSVNSAINRYNDNKLEDIVEDLLTIYNVEEVVPSKVTQETQTETNNNFTLTNEPVTRVLSNLIIAPPQPKESPKVPELKEELEFNKKIEDIERRIENSLFTSNNPYSNININPLYYSRLRSESDSSNSSLETPPLLDSDSDWEDDIEAQTPNENSKKCFPYIINKSFMKKTKSD